MMERGCGCGIEKGKREGREGGRERETPEIPLSVLPLPPSSSTPSPQERDRSWHKVKDHQCSEEDDDGVKLCC